MSKFCGNCGAMWDDDAKICGECGLPLDGVSANTAKLKLPNPERKKKIKKIITLFVVLAILAVVAVVSIKVVKQYTGYNGLLRKVMAAYEDCDVDSLLYMSSDMYSTFDLNDPNNADWAERYFENRIDTYITPFESSVGHSFKLSYEVKEAYEVSERKENEMINEIELLHPDFDTYVIEKIVIADLTMTAKQGKKSVHQDVDIVMTKEDGTWRLLYIN